MHKSNLIKLSSLLGSISVASLLSSKVVLAATTPAATPPAPTGLTEGSSAAAGTLSGNGISITSLLTTVTDTLIFIVGAISVIMIIIGGIRYVVSAGNATHVTAAKNTIMYAIVGLVISIAAYAIVTFIFNQLGVA